MVVGLRFDLRFRATSCKHFLVFANSEDREMIYKQAKDVSNK